MPNGHDISDEDFGALEAPLASIDVALERFAVQVAAQYERNYHDSPNRRIVAKSNDGMVRMIDITPIADRPHPQLSPHPLCYAVTLFVWTDRDGIRRLWHEHLRSLSLIGTPDMDSLSSILAEGWAKLMGFTIHDLEKRGQTIQLRTRGK